MPTLEEVQQWDGRDLVGPDEDKIGKIDRIYLDRETGEPTFASVKTGLFGSKSSLVPIDAATGHGEHVHVPFAKDVVKDAPNVDADEELSETEEQRLYEHYGQSYNAYDGPDHASFDERERVTGAPVGQAPADPTTDTTAAPVNVEATGGAWAGTTGEPAGTAEPREVPVREGEAAMTRSEEDLRVGKQTREVGRARLRKYIVTENVTQTIPVSHEEVRIEREPITEGAATPGAPLAEEEHEVTLHAERPVVEKEVVAKERVRLDTTTVTEDAQIDESVSKEQIEIDGDVQDPR